MVGQDVRVAAITGGAGGVGRAVAMRLHEAGWRIALLGRRGAALEAAAAEFPFEVETHEADVTSRTAVEVARDRISRSLGSPRLVVNAAGVAVASPLLPPDDQLWDDTLAVNVTGAWVVSTAFLPGMVDAGGGAIVNIASTAALRGFRFVAAYVASKHALLGLTRAMALDLEKKNVRVNAVCPGFLDTPMTDRSIAAIRENTGASEDDARAQLASMNASGRLIRPEEVAAQVLRLAGDDAPTGEAIVLD